MKKIFLISTLFVILVASQSFGATIDFVDTAKFWPGWGNGTNDDNQDTIGIPNFTGGTANINDGKLVSLTFNNATTSSSYWGAISPGDLFIDINGDDIWDYYVDLTSWSVSGTSNPDPASGDYNIYPISLALNSSTGYILSGSDNNGGWSGYLIRDGHPVAYNGTGTQIGQVGFSGWGTAPSSTYTFDFGDVLSVGQTFIIGWTVNCANDVIYEKISVPEPSTLLLLGAGLLGLGLVARRRKK